jgi:phenylacetate-coenzyme A ligase PaaK-like adenylate-forming protein
VQEGEEGFFVWTGFLNRAMPLIRYRIGDRGRRVARNGPVRPGLGDRTKVG